MKSNFRLSPWLPRPTRSLRAGASVLLLAAVSLAAQSIESITRVGTNVVIQFTGQLQSATALAGPYNGLAAPPPSFSTPPTGSFRVFRSTGAIGVSPATVGYARIPLVPGLNLISNPFDNGSGNRVADLLGKSLPNGTTLCKFTGGEWGSMTYDSAQGIWIGPTLTLPPGDGAYLKLPAGTTAQLLLLGFVVNGSLDNPPLAPVGPLACYEAFSPRRPVAGTPEDLLGRPISDGTKVAVYRSDLGTYQEFMYSLGDWSGPGNTAPVIGIGQTALICEDPGGGGQFPDPSLCAPQFPDVTQPGDFIQGNFGDGAPEFAVENAIDNTPARYREFNKFNAGFTVIPGIGPTLVQGLSLTSADDFPERDPSSYVLEASIDGIVYKPIAFGVVPVFTKRSQTLVLSFPNDITYVDYRLTFPTVVDQPTADSMQIAEVELLGKPSELPLPVAYQFLNPNGGDWDTPSNWLPFGVPGALDSASLGGVDTYTVKLQSDVAVSALVVGTDFGGGPITLDLAGHALAVTGSGRVRTSGILKLDNGGTLAGPGGLLVSGRLDWTDGSMEGAGVTTIDSAGVLGLAGPGVLRLNRQLRNEGQAVWTGGELRLRGAVVDNRGMFVSDPGTGELDLNGTVSASSFLNYGTLTKIGSGLTRVLAQGATMKFSNFGTLDLEAGILSLESSFQADSQSRSRFLLAGVAAPGQHAVLNLPGVANLSGILDVALVPGYLPNAGDLFDIVTYGSPGTGFGASAGEADHFDRVTEALRLRLRREAGPNSDRPPQITGQPAGRTANAGDVVVLDVVATGSPEPSYQWRRNGQNIPGETGPQLVLSITGPESAGSYACVVYNDLGAVLSDPAVVVVNAPSLPFADAFAARGAINTSAGVGVGVNIAATREASEPLHAGKAGSHSVWIDYVAPDTGVLDLTTIGSDFDTLLAVYTGPLLAGLVPVVSDDDGALYYASHVSFAVTSGQHYAVAVDGRAGVSGHIVLRWSLSAGAPPPPQVLAAPVVQLARPGGSATFSVLAAATTSFQWYKDGVALSDGGKFSGTATATLHVADIAVSDVGNYAVELRGKGSLRTPPVALQVNPAAPAGPAVPIAGARDKFSDLLDERGSFLPRSGAQPAGGGHSLPAGLARGVSGAQYFSSVGSSTETGEPVLCGVPGGASQWLDYLADFDGTLTVDTSDSLIDTVLAAYYVDCADCSTDDILQTLVPLACDDNVSQFNLTSRISFAITNGSIYTLVVDGVKGASGVVSLKYHAAPAAPVLSHVTTSVDGHLRFDVSGPVDFLIRVESSDDLVKFKEVITTSLPLGGLQFIDPLPVSASEQRFFRAVFP